MNTQEHNNEYNVEVEANRFTALLFCISKLYKIDYATLLLLYEKLDKDLMYIFYLFSGKKITFPTSTKFQSLVYSANNILNYLKEDTTEDDNNSLTQDERDLASELNNILDLNKNRIVVPLDIIYNVE